jgi:Tfp pilus assembly protein PilO
MSKGKFSIVLSVLLVTVLIVWFTFFYYPKSIEINRVKSQIKEMRNNLASASQANVDIENIEKKLLNEKNKLEAVKARFVEKDDLASVSRELGNFAKKYNLRLTDFAPVFDEYYSDTTNTTVKALPLAITVKGTYLNIGRFIEDWGNLPFYLEANEISMQRFKPKSNDLEAVISSKLYAWNH